MLETRDRRIEERYKNRWYGKYRAFVRDHHDPERLGRCRLEIPAVLGTGRENWSEWAAPCFPYGGNDDTGMFLVPEEGASVWAEFEGGLVQYPIWTGVWLARSNPGEQPEESKRLCSSADCFDCGDRLEHAARHDDDLEHRKYHGHPSYSCPRMKVLLKTETGHTILADDRHGSECLQIIDRAGQVIHLEGQVKPETQAGGSSPRGVRTAERGDQVNLRSDVRNHRGRVEITDLSRQFIRWEAWQNREKIHIQSCDASRTRWQKILLDTTVGREKIRIRGLGGCQEIVIDSTAGQEAIRLRDKAGQMIEMNATPGAEHIRLTDRAGSFVWMNPAAANVTVKAAGLVLINPV